MKNYFIYKDKLNLYLNKFVDKSYPLVLHNIGNN